MMDTSKLIKAYKVMPLGEDGKLFSGANKSLTFNIPKPGEVMTMPGKGIYMSPNQEYVLDYYSEHNPFELLIEFEIDVNDITSGNLTDNEAEISVSKAKVISTQQLDNSELFESINSQPEKWYHHSNRSGIEELRESEEGALGEGVYLTTEEHNPEHGRHTYVVEVNVNDTIVLDDTGEEALSKSIDVINDRIHNFKHEKFDFSKYSLRDFSNDALNDFFGVDSTLRILPTGEKHLCVYDASNVKIINSYDKYDRSLTMNESISEGVNDVKFVFNAEDMIKTIINSVNGSGGFNSFISVNDNGFIYKSSNVLKNNDLVVRWLYSDNGHYPVYNSENKVITIPFNDTNFNGTKEKIIELIYEYSDALIHELRHWYDDILFDINQNSYTKKSQLEDESLIAINRMSDSVYELTNIQYRNKTTEINAIVVEYIYAMLNRYLGNSVNVDFYEFISDLFKKIDKSDFTEDTLKRIYKRLYVFYKSLKSISTLELESGFKRELIDDITESTSINESIDYTHQDIMDKKDALFFEANYMFDDEYKSWFDSRYINSNGKPKAKNLVESVKWVNFRRDTIFMKNEYVSDWVDSGILTESSLESWFGKSVVRNKDGSPKVMYHGSSAKFDSFDISKVGDTNGRSEGAGFYFTDDKDIADGYSGRDGDSHLYEVYLKIEKPIAHDQKALNVSQCAKLVKAVAQIEAEEEGMEIGDGYLANYGDVSYEGLNNVIRSVADSLQSDDTILDQVGGIIGSGVRASVVNEALYQVFGFDGYYSKGFGGEGGRGGNIFIAMFPWQIKKITNDTFGDGNNMNESIANGNNIVVYRGIRSSNDKPNMSSTLGYGKYVTNNIDVAKAYSNEDGAVLTYNLNLNNPLVFDWVSDEGRDESVKIGQLIGIDVKPGNWINGDGNEVSEKIKANGYDGLIVKQPESDLLPQHLEIVVFDESSLSEINKSINESQETENIQPDSIITVYHGTSENRLRDMFKSGVIDATKVVYRQYNQGKERGLYVTNDINVAKKFGNHIIEFKAKGKNLYPTNTFGASKDTRNNKEMQKMVNEKYPNSFRPFTSYTFDFDTEPQAMFIGTISVSDINRLYQFDYSEKGQPLKEVSLDKFYNIDDDYSWDVNWDIDNILNYLSELHGVSLEKVVHIIRKYADKLHYLGEFNDMPRKLQLRLKEYARSLKTSGDLTESIINYKDYTDKIKSMTDQELINFNWDNELFGFTFGDEIEIPLDNLKVKWHDDMLNVDGFNMKEYFKGEDINNLPPIEVSFDGKDFYIEDGHHRYGYAKELGLEKVKVVIDSMRIRLDQMIGTDLDGLMKYKHSLTESFNDDAGYDLLKPIGKSINIGEEKGKYNSDGFSLFKNPYGSLRFVYSENNEILAALQVMSTDGGKTGVIANIYTHPDHRRKGLGTELHKYAKTKVRHLVHSDSLTDDGNAWKNTLSESINGAMIQTEAVTAYHGTGMDFDSFDMDKVGSGEEVTKYGHGIYFTASEDTAKYYADRAAGGGKVYTVKLLESPQIDWDDTISSSFGVDNLSELSIDLAGREAVETLTDIAEEYLDGYYDYNRYEEMLTRVLVNRADQEAWEELEEAIDRDAMADDEIAFEWDNLYKLLSKASIEFEVDEQTFGDLYNYLCELQDPKVISQLMVKRGINLIKYQGNETGEDITNYVVFNPSIIKIMN